MTDNPKDTSTNAPAEAPEVEAKATDGADWASNWDGKTESLPPRVREMLRKANEEAASYRTQKRAAEEAEKKRMAEAGEYKSLYDKLSGEVEPLKARSERAEALEAFVTETVKAQIEALPTQFRSLVPEYDDPLKTLSWLQANAKTLAPPKAPNLDPGQRGTAAASTPLNSEQAALAARFGITPEQFEKARQGK